MTQEGAKYKIASWNFDFLWNCPDKVQLREVFRVGLKTTQNFMNLKVFWWFRTMNAPLWTQGMHQDYGLTFPLEVLKRLYQVSENGAFVTPPTHSYFHPPKHRSHQKIESLKFLANKAKRSIDKSYRSVRFIRFDQLTEFCDSVDGVHYGHNVNTVLFSIYLNGLK